VKSAHIPVVAATIRVTLAGVNLGFSPQIPAPAHKTTTNHNCNSVRRCIRSPVILTR
jgi:hypothetical protein